MNLPIQSIQNRIPIPEGAGGPLGPHAVFSLHTGRVTAAGGLSPPAAMARFSAEGEVALIEVPP